MKIREAEKGDLDGLLALYAQFRSDPVPEKDCRLKEVWSEILEDRRHHIVVAEEDGKVVSSCVCLIVPNLTHGFRPYAVIENVITDGEYRKRGLASACLEFAGGIAAAENCYKMMLLTGSKLMSTMRFYERAGYNRRDKTAFIRWL